MPAHVPPTFASAAASNGNSNDGSGRGGGSDWSRSRPNGSTQTFRRPSQNINSTARDTSQTISSWAGQPHIPPPGASQPSQRSGGPGETRFSKEQLLDMYKSIGQARGVNGDVHDILTEGWEPGAPNYASNGTWSRREDAREGVAGPDVCWESNGTVQPLGLYPMTDEERELFATSVNSPIKPPPQNATKEGVQTPGLNGRKPSFSQASASSISGSRPATRRRETSDAQQPSNPLASPTPFTRSKDESALTNPPSLLMRRRTDFKDGSSGPSFGERARLDTAGNASSPFGSLKRTGPASASIHGPSSPWAPSGPQSAGFGAFGSFNIDSTATPTTPGEKKMGLSSVRSESRFRGLMGKDSSEDVNKLREKNLSLLERLGETESDRNAPSQWGHQPSSSHPAKEGNILDEFDHRIGSAALGGDDTLEEDRANEGTDTDDDRHSNPYSNRGPAKPFGATFEGGDRSQTSSTGPSRFSGLGGIGGVGNIGSAGGWPTAPGAVVSSARGPSGFGNSFTDSLFNSMGDVSSPGGVFGTPPSNAYGGMARGSKMGALFPQGMQDQMRSEHNVGELGPSRGIGTPGHGVPSRDTESPARQGPGILDDLFYSTDVHARGGAAAPSTFSQSEMNPTAASGGPMSMQASIAAPIAGPTVTNPPSGPSHDASSNQMPAAQQRQMVMPDRMRWIYRDPQGNTQGPWSGLEMHDWYKAGFFSPELLVRKQEDTDYEPLAQLIRRIGNSREPFLVPQIGIPHGPATAQQGGSSSVGGIPNSAGMQSGLAQPPFASNFPSFGTTLTAEQQNALERRKQEEQFLMARQKEHLAHQQVIMRQQFQTQGMPSHGVHPQSLQHHSSAHSLQSQPSYGSIASPSGGYQASPAPMPLQQQQQQQQQQGGMPGLYDRSGPPLGNFGNDANSRENDLSSRFDRTGLSGTRPSPFGGPGGPMQPGMDHQQQINTMLQDRAWLQREQDQAGFSGQLGERESMDRLEQYHQLRASEEPEQPPAHHEPSVTTMEEPLSQPEGASLDITEQSAAARVMEAGAAPASEEQDLGPAPAPSISPLPAPSAQRNRQHVADKLNVETSSRSESPSAETPTTATMAPWAKENLDGPKGPSLREIQETEARKAAQQEGIVAAQRRALAEQERMAAAQAQAQNVAGLPSGANWAAASSPTAATPSAWTKKTTVATPPTSAKKTLSQIQKEEEARKNRAAAAAAAAGPTVSVAAGPSGKRYADLASKGASPAPPAAGGAWTTVGASGKAKPPATPATPAAPQRTASGNVTTLASKAAAPARATTATNSKQLAADELQRWAKTALGKGMNAGINVDEFVRHLLTFPPDAELVADSVYGNSTTLDGRRFAEEFVRRRKLADKGQVAPDGTVGSYQTAGSSANSGPSGSDSKGSGGWSEVAKKGSEKTGTREEATAFKVVAARKKGKR